MIRVLRRWREARTLARRPIPEALWSATLAGWPFLAWRPAADRQRLRDMATLFLADKEWAGAQGLTVTDAMAVAIAAQACLPVLRLGLAPYAGFKGIVVQPDVVVARRSRMDDIGVVHEYDEELAGEAMEGGPVMLSWRDVREGGRASLGTQGYNVVVHEFAHVLDMEDGIADGVPLLPTGITRAQWLAVLEPEFERFEARVDQDPELESVLDPYAATSIDEFFAVVSESFFVDPRGLAAEHASLYALLKQFYRQDPAAFAPR